MLPSERPLGRADSEVPAAEPEAATRRTIPIVGDPDKPKLESRSEHPSPTAGDNGDTERPTAPIPAPQAVDSA